MDVLRTNDFLLISRISPGLSTLGESSSPEPVPPVDTAITSFFFVSASVFHVRVHALGEELNVFIAALMAPCRVFNGIGKVDIK